MDEEEERELLLSRLLMAVQTPLGSERANAGEDAGTRVAAQTSAEQIGAPAVGFERERSVRRAEAAALLLGPMLREGELDMATVFDLLSPAERERLSVLLAGSSIAEMFELEP